MFYADAEFPAAVRDPGRGIRLGSTEAGGVSQLRRWAATEDMPADASRHGGPCAPASSGGSTRDGTIFVRPAVVAQVAALPRDSAADKVQRHLLCEQPVLSWSELG